MALRKKRVVTDRKDAAALRKAVAKDEAKRSDMAVVEEFLKTPINGHLPNIRYAPLQEVRPWTVFTTPGIQLCAASLGTLVAEMRRLLEA